MINLDEEMKRRKNEHQSRSENKYVASRSLQLAGMPEKLEGTNIYFSFFRNLFSKIFLTFKFQAVIKTY